MSTGRRRRFTRRSHSTRRIAAGGSRRSASTFASTTSPPGSTRCSPRSIESRPRHGGSAHASNTCGGITGRGTSIASGMTELSHLSEAGDVRMVDVGGKPLSRRRAVARATVHMASDTARRLRELPKGDALVTAQIAGIMAAKRTSELIPLCHPLPLSHVEVSLEVGDEAVEITGIVETTAQTGVEMEALTAVSVAALTVYDMAKAIDTSMSVTEVTLVEKTKEPA